MLRLMKMILMILLYVMTMLTKLLCAVTVTSSESYLLNEINEHDFKDIKVVLSMRQDKIPVVSVINKS